MYALWQFIEAKDWSLYPFISPVFSLLISLYVVPMYNDLYSKKLLSYLNSEGIAELFELINGVAKDRGLQIAYLTSVPSFLSSLVATLKSNHPILLTTIVMILLVPSLVLFLRVFISDPGYHAMTNFHRETRSNELRKKDWTYLALYSKILALLNIIFIIVIIIALPNKTP